MTDMIATKPFRYASRALKTNSRFTVLNDRHRKFLERAKVAKLVEPEVETGKPVVPTSDTSTPPEDEPTSDLFTDGKVAKEPAKKRRGRKSSSKES